MKPKITIEEAEENLILYVSTLLFAKTMFKKREEIEIPFVYIDYKKIVPYIKPYNLTELINKLVRNGRLTKHPEKTLYQTLENDYFSEEFMPKVPELTDNLYKSMYEYLTQIKVPDDFPDNEKTQSIHTFLNCLQEIPEIAPRFFKVDNHFSNRIYTPITNLKKEYREFLTINGEKLSSVDVAQMQPQILGAVLQKHIGDNEYSTWLTDGKDIYEVLQEKKRLKSRGEAKIYFFEIIFGKPSKSLEYTFGSSEWVKWINDYKRLVIPENPSNEKKPHSNLSWLLQNKEGEIMRKIWRGLVDASIPFLSIHDEALVPQSRVDETKAIFNQVLSTYFATFKVSCKNSELQAKPSETIRGYELDELYTPKKPA